MGRFRKNADTENLQVVSEKVDQEVSEDVTDQETIDVENETEVETSNEVETETADEAETENSDKAETAVAESEPENVEDFEYPKTVHLVCPKNFYRNLADTTPKRITGTIVLLEDLGSYYKASRIVPGFGVVVGYLDK